MMWSIVAPHDVISCIFVRALSPIADASVDDDEFQGVDKRRAGWQIGLNIM